MFPLHIFTFPRRIFIGATALVVFVLLAGIFLAFVEIQPFSHQHSVSAAAMIPQGTVYLSPSAQAAAVSTLTLSKQTTMREVHIANNGLMLLRGAQVISISGTDMLVGIDWDFAHFTWTVKTDSGTKFIASKGEKETLADIQTGSTVDVTGMLTDGGAEPTINADFVRE